MNRTGRFEKYSTFTHKLLFYINFTHGFTHLLHKPDYCYKEFTCYLVVLVCQRRQREKHQYLCSIMGFSSNDAAHLFFGLPVMIYGHLIALDAYLHPAPSQPNFQLLLLITTDMGALEKGRGYPSGQKGHS